MADLPRTEAGTFAGKLTPALAQSLCESVSTCLFDQQVALKHGIDISTLKSWVDRGIDEEAVEPYRSFAEAYLRQSIELEERLLAKVLAAGDPWVALKESVETSTLARGFDETSFDDCDSSDAADGVGAQLTNRTVSKTCESRRGDWKASAWVLERRWPLRWSTARQPDGGPKEAIRLPDSTPNRRRKVHAQMSHPSPEMIKAFADNGYDIVRRKDAAPSAAPTPRGGTE